MTIERKRNSAIGLGLGMVLALILSVSPANVGLTGERAGEGVGLPEHYPHKFTDVGRIDRMAEDEIVINDTLYRLAPYVEYHTPTSMNASKFMLPTGSLVGFLTNSENIITSLWLLREDRN